MRTRARSTSRRPITLFNTRQQARKWWVEQYVAPALHNPLIDGVYTDCSCGTAKGEVFTAAEAAGRQQAFAVV